MQRKIEQFDVTKIEAGLSTELIPQITNWIILVLKELNEQTAQVATNGDFSGNTQVFIPFETEVRLHIEAIMEKSLIEPAAEIGDNTPGHWVSNPKELFFVEEVGKIGEHSTSVHARLDSNGLESILLPNGTEAENKFQDDSQLLVWFCGVINFLNSRLEKIE